MRIAIYTGTFIRDQDGATKTVYELTDFLLKRGMEVGIWSFAITPQKRDHLHLFPVPSVPLPIYRDYRIAFPSTKLRLELLTFNPDLIHVTTPDLVGTWIIRFANEKNIPVITSFHTDFPAYLKSYRLALFENVSWKYLRWFYNQSHSVFAPTNAVARKLNHRGVKNVKLWTRGIYGQKFNPRFRSSRLRDQWNARGKKVILYSGRFVWYKDLDTFSRVYTLFQEKGAEKVVFVLAGDGPIRSELERRMPKAHFTGYLHGEELSKVYASSDILLFPSTTETFGNVVQEALASGVPAVVSNVGGCKEIVQNSQAGFIVKAGDPVLFYQHCKRLVEDRQLYQAMHKRGLQYAADQDWDQINGRLIAEYHTLINYEKQAVHRRLRDRGYPLQRRLGVQ